MSSFQPVITFSTPGSPATMSTNPSILTSKTTLMHASLAYLTNEIHTLDDIICSPYAPSVSRKPTLPTEILLLIREWLFPSITAQLIAKSAHALEAYEHSLCNLLCADCVAYNVDIYGPDIWQWEQFYGACACAAPAGNEDPHGYRSARINRRHRQENYRSEPITFSNSNLAHVINIQNPKQFTDVNHWLEIYLFSEAAAAKETLCAYVRRNKQSVEPSDDSWPLLDIWDIVTAVLRDFNCEAVREQPENRGQPNTKRDLIEVVPLRRHMDSGLERICEVPNAERIQQEVGSWHTQATLDCASRDLGLMNEYAEVSNLKVIGTCRPFVPVVVRSGCWCNASHPCPSPDRSDISHILQTLFDILALVTRACLSFPLACATVVLTVLCFYSKPRSLRIF